MNYHRISVLTGILLLGLTIAATAAYPPFINYQGRLTDAEGNPVPDGIYNLTFTIWDAYTDGNPLWTSDPMPINVEEGLFNVVLGEIGSVVFIPAADRFLGIKIGDDPEMSPRTWLVTVPYAYYAGQASASVTCPAWTINGDNVYHSHGNVGIGVNNPLEPLAIGETFAEFNGTYITISDTGSYGLSGIVMGESADHYATVLYSEHNDAFAILQRAGFTYTVLQAIQGKVGIGEVNPPQFKLQVKSDGEGDGLRVDSHTGNQMFRVRQNSDNSCEIQVSDNTGAVKAMIRSNGDSYFNGGDVGIGTTSPNYTLDVRGTIGNNTTLYHSDRRWKKDIAPLNDALESVTRLRGVSYQWKRDEYPDMNFPDGRQIGLIAQEVEAVVPEVVHTADDGFKSIDYAKLLAVMAEAIKTQQEQIENLSARIKELEETR